MTEHVVAVYAQQTLLAGEQCWKEELIESESEDVVIYSGTEGELIETAEHLERSAKEVGAGTDLYFLHVARTLREAVETEVYND